MRRLLTILLLFSIIMNGWAQATQPCIVKQYNQKQPKTPLAGVEVMASNAGSTVSASDGRLTLSFRTLKPGDKVKLISAKKAGYEIFNSEAVEQWNISRSNTPFSLVMVKSDYLANLKGKITQTSTESYRAKYEQAVRELKQLKKTGKLKEDEYNKKYDELDTKFQEQLKNLDNYIDQFVRIDLSEISAEEQRILDMVQEGRIDEAVKAYEQLGLVEKLGTETSSFITLSDAVQRINEEKKRKKNNIDELYEAVQRQAYTLRLAKKNSESEQVLSSMLKAMTPLFKQSPEEYRSKIAQTQLGLGLVASSSIDQITYFLSAIKEYNILVDQSPVYISDLATAQYQLGFVYNLDNQYTKAEELYLKAMGNYSLLFEKDPTRYRYDYAEVKARLGTVYNYTHRLSQAEKYYLQAMDIIAPLSKQNYELYCRFTCLYCRTIGTFYNHYPNYYHNDSARYSKAEKYYLRAYKSLSYLVSRNHYSSLINHLLRSQKELGNYYKSRLNDSAKANVFYRKYETYYGKQIDSLTVLFQTNPLKYGEELISAQHKLGWHYYLIDDTINAEKYYLQETETYTKLFRNMPTKYEKTLADKLSEIAFEYDNFLNNPIKAAKYRLIAKKELTNEVNYLEAEAEIKLGIGDCFYELHDYKKAEMYYHEALANYSQLVPIHEDCRSELAWAQYSLVFVYAKDKTKLDQYDDMLDAALANYELLCQEDNKYWAAIVDLQNRKGWRYLNKGKTDEAIDLFESTYKKDPEETAAYLASGYNAKAYEYAKAKDYWQAINTIDKAISLDPDEPNLYDSKGEILLMKGDEKGALEMWKKVMDLDPVFLSKHNGSTDFHKQLLKRGLIQ